MFVFVMCMVLMSAVTFVEVVMFVFMMCMVLMPAVTFTVVSMFFVIHKNILSVYMKFIIDKSVMFIAIHERMNNCSYVYINRKNVLCQAENKIINAKLKKL